MTEQVFLSYAEEDGPIARRIHQSLARSQMPVWGYKEDGRVGVNFKEEFSERIRSSRYFCLIDTKHSRQSPWIRDECKLARESHSVMVVCTADPEVRDGWKDHELFENQNLIRAIDFTNFDAGIHTLCRHLQIVYSPGWSLPRDQDFENEVFGAPLSRDQMQEVQSLYRDFREQYSDPVFAEAQLRVIIRKCLLYGAKDIISPSLALGVMLGEAGRHRAALDLFAQLSDSHPRDPRVWAGLGGAHFHLGAYPECLAALTRSREAILLYYREESGPHLAEVVHNIASTLLLLGRNQEAWAAIDGLSTEERDHSYIRALQGRLLLAEGRPAEALLYLESAYADSMKRSDYSIPLMIGLADCYRRLSRPNEEIRVMEEAMKALPGQVDICIRAANCFLFYDRIPGAVVALRKATDSVPQSVTYRAQLASVLLQAGNAKEAADQARQCIGAELTAPERYYRGLAYYIAGRRDIAEYELTEARMDKLVSTWPHYSQVLSNRSSGR